jgi:hypothetical protein
VKFGRCTETEKLHADHVHPHSKGGSTTVANGQVLCSRHNKQKAARIPFNWELWRLEKQRASYFGRTTAVQSSVEQSRKAVDGCPTSEIVPCGAVHRERILHQQVTLAACRSGDSDPPIAA